MIIERTGIDVRRAGASDAAALTAVCRDAWRQAYTGIIPTEQLDQMLARRDQDWWSSACLAKTRPLVLTVANDVKGYATYGPSRSRRRPAGEIYELYLTPVCQGIGLGEYLFESCRDSLDRNGHRELRVWALAANSAAQQFYWSRGGRPAFRTRERFGRVVLDKICFAFD